MTEVFDESTAESDRDSESSAAPAAGDTETVTTAAAEAIEAIKQKRRQSDPIVTALWFAVLSIVVLTLVTVAYALATGVLGTGAPKTAAQQRVVTTGGLVKAGSKEPADWRNYVDALIEVGEYGEAQRLIDRGKASLKEQEISADMVYMQAKLHHAQEEFDLSLKSADEALNTIKTTYEAAKDAGVMSKAASFGINENYWDLLLLKADILQKQNKLTEAKAVYDEYLAENKTAADVFTMRGVVKEKLGDDAGAEQDYKRTLAFIPDHTQALAGIKRIGAEQ